jgi:hypothetical protein
MLGCKTNESSAKTHRVWTMQQNKYAPRCIVVSADTKLAGNICRTMMESGWQVDLSVAPPSPKIDAQVDLLIFDRRATGQNVEFVQLRNAAKATPIVALVENDAPAQGFDAVIDARMDAEQLAAALEPWRPTPDAARLEQIGAAMGMAAIRSIANGLAEELDSAVAELDAGEVTRAHRIAGLAGTLGFSAVSGAWNALSHGEMEQAPTARREARLAVAAIAKWLGAEAEA